MATKKPAAEKAKTTKPAKAKAPAASKANSKAKPAKVEKPTKAPKPVGASKEPKAPGGKSTDALREYAKGYHKDKERKTASGNVSVDNGDELATKLRGMDLEAVYGVAAKALGEDVQTLKGKYGHLNVGMIRMNLGNRLRAALNAK